MNIPEEIVEKAARAAWAQDHRGLDISWESDFPDTRDAYRETTHAALSAAAPTLMAMAWDEVSDFLDSEFGDGAGNFVYNNNPYKEHP